MSTDSADAPMVWPADGSLAFDSRSQFRDAVRLLFERVAQLGCKEVVLCDPDFDDWPLDEPVVLDALSRWALAHRKLTLLSGHFDHFDRAHPRWVVWRRTWGHVVDCRAADEQDAADLPSLMVADPLGAIRRADPRHWRGWAYGQRNDMRRCTEMVDAALQRSAPAFPVTNLGL